MNKPLIYLAGSIRDGIKEDVEWRERAVDQLQDVAQILSPMAGKMFDAATGRWSLYGKYNPDSGYIVQADYWCVDRADIILFDFRSLAAKYASIGTLSEWGRSTGRPILRLVTVEGDYKGHDNLRHFPGLHPFIAEHAAMTFNDVDEMISFARNYCAAVTLLPRYNEMVAAR